ncbi:amidohydrolase family protein [Actinomadura physcomitrii]|nr:amidohydrolase family protein [Actinomadura physcomitrii]
MRVQNDERTAGPSRRRVMAAAGAGRLLFGTDWPQVARPEADGTTALLDRDPSLDRRAHAAVDRGNALRLLPRLARRLSR